MMTELELDQVVMRLGKLTADLLIDDKRMRQLVREVVLRTVVELEQIRAMGIVRNFLASCEARKVKVTIDAAGRIWARPKSLLGADLSAVLIGYREEIARHLEEVRRLEQRDASTDFNGKPMPNGNGVHTPKRTV